VVVIDNDVAVLEAMQSLLQRWSCHVVLVRNLTEADELAAAGLRPDIILADYHLDADTCGLTAVDALRRAAGCQVPAVVITADRSASVAEAARQRGCETLLKPVKPAELRALMQHLIAGRSAQAR
jgi:CheY-like chemotaxis protein